MKAQAKSSQLEFRTYLESKENKNRYYVKLAPHNYDVERANQIYRDLKHGIPVLRADIFWAREIGRKLLRLETDPDFFSSEGQHKMEASNKASKGELKSFVLHFAAAGSSGYQVCSSRSAGCEAACLFTAGHGAICNVTAGRIKRTRLYFEHRAIWAILLFDQLSRLSKRSYQVAVRLNGTSDLPHEAMNGDRWIFDMFNGSNGYNRIQFYDYTAILGRLKKSLPDNYHLTFSRKEDNHDKAMLALERGYSVSMVFSLPVYSAVIEAGNWCGYPVVDGTIDDRRFLDAPGSVVVLKELGKAKQDDSGFVIRSSLQAVGGIL